MVDIVIGTHRVLSKDMQFKDLGLLIIDEEQRFGVAHKEKIKHLKENVDVLTLTATPIPRTLHMSLAGIRDMSVLEEPPVDRTPIQTYVMEYNEEMVREAINRELARNGQVYYVYNRVTDIDEVAGRVQALVPDAVVTFAHGQMREHELERIMADFINGEIDVLVSTTIIETGLDIPNANTMIIHDADRMGLSQLYQLRGRVGRSNRTSYAFLMYKRDKLLREEAEIINPAHPILGQFRHLSQILIPRAGNSFMPLLQLFVPYISLKIKDTEITAAFPTKIVLYYGSIFLTGPAGGIIVSPRPIQPVQFGVPPFFL
mgnify:CR=1 FL=1